MATVVIKTPEAIPRDGDLHARIRYDREQYGKRFPEGESIQEYRDYRKGKHALQLTAEALLILEGLEKHKFCDNLAHKVTADARDRVQFLGWECENEQTGEYLGNLYRMASMLERMPKTVYETFGDGDYGLAVGWNNEKQRVTVNREPWWDGACGLYIGYNQQDDTVYAVKDWEEQQFKGGNISTPILRRIVWFDDRLERWSSGDAGNSWEPYKLPADNGRWPIYWTEGGEKGGKPLGIPYIHLRNSGRGEDVYGTSIIAATLGLIDQIQDMHYALCGAARMSGYPIVTATGVELEPDPERAGEFKELAIRCGALLRSANPLAKFGVIAANDPQGLLNTLTEKKQSLSIVTQTPLHNLTGVWPSGEALMRAEQPAIGQADTQVSTLQRAMVSVAVMAITLQNEFGSGPEINSDVETATISATFAPTERRDPLSKSVIVSNLGDTISPEEGLRLMGYTDKEIEKIEEEKAAKQTRDIENQNKLFSRGVGPGTNIPGRGASTGEPDDSSKNVTAAAPAQNAKPGNAKD